LCGGYVGEWWQGYSKTPEFIELKIERRGGG
jgi:hypothetical protein